MLRSEASDSGELELLLERCLSFPFPSSGLFSRLKARPALDSARDHTFGDSERLFRLRASVKEEANSARIAPGYRLASASHWAASAATRAVVFRAANSAYLSTSKRALTYYFGAPTSDSNPICTSC